MEDISEWKQFFDRVGVKEQGSKEYVDDFGVNFIQDKLKSEFIKEKIGYYFTDLISVEKRKKGYDFIGKIMNGEEKYLEIKSRVRIDDIELTPHETEQADIYGDNYLLCIVVGIPENPELYIVPNPVKHGKKDRVTIPLNVWKGFKLGS